MIKYKILLPSLILTLSMNAFANVGNDLDNYFNNLGYSSNTTMPSVYESQAAGSYGGGSLYIRNQTRNYQLVQLDMPSASAGCGGIDLYTGSLSFIKGEKLKELAKHVMSSSAAYAFDIALSSTVPQLKDIKDRLQQVEQFENGLNISSCEASKKLVNGVLSIASESQKSVCKEEGTMGAAGKFDDYTDATSHCANSNDFKDAIDKASNDPKRKEQVIINKNIIWSLLKSKSTLTDDRQLSELLMSLTGTIIFDKEGKMIDVPSLANSRGLIQAILGRDDGVTEKAQIWHCTDNADDCLKVRLSQLNIGSKKTLKAKVTALVSGIYEKVKTDVELSPSDKAFIAMTHIPIFKFITLLASTEYGVNAVDLEDYSMLIAQDLLTQYFSELLQEARNVTSSSAIPPAVIDKLTSRIQLAQAAVNKLTPEVGKKLEQKLMLITRVQVMERQIAATAQTQAN